MKILIFNTLYYPNQVGGAEKSVQLLAEGLTSKGYEVVVVCTSDKEYIDFINGVKVFYMKGNNLYWPYEAKKQSIIKKFFWHLIDSYNIFNKNKIEIIIKKEKPNVVHTNNLSGISDIVWKIAKKYNIKVVHTLRDYYQLCPSSTMFKNGRNCDTQCLTCKIYSIGKKQNSKYVDSIIGISEYILKRHLLLGYFQNSVKNIVYNPVQIHNENVKSSKKIISLGYVGSISPSKGIEFLLEQYIKLKMVNTELLIFGKGTTKEYELKLKQKYKDDKIIFKGFIKAEAIYEQIDILIVPSLWNEPFGRIVPEANNYKIPTLVTNKGGLPELVINGQNGYVFNPDIEGDFEEKLNLTINMHKQNQFKFDLRNFDFENIINQYLDVYTNV